NGGRGWPCQAAPGRKTSSSVWTSSTKNWTSELPMNLWQLVNKEIRFRKVGFAIGMVSIAVAIASLVGSVTLLRAYEMRTEQILAERERATREEMKQLENDYRNIMRDMGYNVMVLHEDQSIAAMRAAGYP